ncbi:DEAD/DEAH box helicase [Solitalea koreensis]|uniref:Helicase conserved C-terminal domain-containing protein n=1 Tax=Solitalea koreensis TaxID=543615 RepID=A0A521C451_9SPHI|nr:DEAD/DEAH box helicase [Solitalea koreensis]SMO54222.1 Helicase conserved C-terminal domain-containing protein [Solitalea koreensis]
MLRVDSNKPCKIVYSLLQHEFLGFLFEPHIVQLNRENFYSLIHQRLFSHTAQEFAAYLDETDFKLIKLLEQCEQENIIRKYHKKPIRPSEYFPKFYTDEVHARVRPTIERLQSQAINLMRDKRVFEMGKEGNPAWMRLNIADTAASVLFHFRRNEESTRYFPTIKYKDRRIDFMFKDAQVISNSPAWLLLNDTLHFFEGELEGKKLSPFLNKRFIEIPKAAEKNYFEKFVAPLIEKHHVYAEGFEIITEKYEASPILQINPKNELPEIELFFIYDKYRFPFESSGTVSVSVEQIGDNYVFHRVKRASLWEQKKASELEYLGLEKHHKNLYRLKSTDSENLEFSIHEWINDHFDELAEKGFSIEQTEGDKKYVFGKSTINLQFKENNDWFDVHATVRFGNYEIPFIELKNHILNHRKEFLLPSGEIAIIPESWFATYGNLFAFAEGGKHLHLKKHHIGLIKEFTESQLAETIMDRKLQALNTFEGIDDIPTPKHFKGELRPYQKAGFNWFSFLSRYNLGGCLADDMGLGKTVQTLALLQNVKEKSEVHLTSMIVMPTSLIDNWKSEAKKFTPQLKIFVYTGSDRIKDTSSFAEYDVVLTTYGIVRIDTDILHKFYFHYIILDESQNIKNSLSKSAKAVRTLKSKNRLILSGTPVENTIADLWSQLSFANPGLLGNHTYFQNEFIIPIEKKQDEEKLRRLQAIIKPFILRRTKDQVAKELPDKTEQIFYCNMSEEQEKVYEETKSYYRNELLGLIADNGAGKSQIPVLQGLTKLRQIANHPRLTDDNYKHDSWKFSLVLELLQNTLARGHKILVFSQFVKHLSILREELDKMNIGYAYLDGATRKRSDNIREFKEKDDIQLFLISIKAGGTGLNLIEADYVFLLDPWWNPAVEQQAVDRAHRIGQTKNVFIYKFITKNTVEEKILNLQKRKKHLSSSLITVEDSFAKSLSASDIKALLE